MEAAYTIKQQIKTGGFAIIENVFTDGEINKLLDIISRANTSAPTFRKTGSLFAIRQFLKEVPEIVNMIFTERVNRLLSGIFGNDYFVVKSIYFDKPAASNWFVAWHQDLTISVDQKMDLPGFGPWTAKQNQFAVQPPLEILRDNFTIRIHLDDTSEDNGALKVIPGSHLIDICRPETVGHKVEQQMICNVNRGGVMLMKPLLLHASGRSANNSQRRVIHIEFSRCQLPEGLNWAEQMLFTA